MNLACASSIPGQALGAGCETIQGYKTNNIL